MQQSEAAECGLACVGMIADYHGHRERLGELRRRFAIALTGTRIPDLIGIAERLALNARALRLEIDELSQLRLPCVLHWNLDHFVVLERVTGRHVDIVDPAGGRRCVRYGELDTAFTGVAIELTPAAEFRPRSHSRGVVLADFFRAIPRVWRSLGLLLALSIGLQVFALLTPFYSQWVIDDVILTGDRGLLAVLAVGFALLALAQTLIGALRGWTITWMSRRISYDWSSGLFRHLLSLPLAYFEKRHVGDIQSRFGSLVPVRELVTTQTVESLVDGLMATVTLAVLLIYDRHMAAIVVSAVALYGVLRAGLVPSMRRRTLDVVRERAGVESQLLETLRGIAAIKSSGLEDRRLAEYRNRSVDAVNAEAATAYLGVAQQSANQAIFALQNVSVIWLGAERVIAGQMTVGMLVAFLAYMNQFSIRAAALIDKIAQFRLVSAHTERLADIIEAESEVSPDGIATAPPLVLGGAEIDARDLAFRYGDNAPWILDALNLHVHSGESVAIVAPSGNGKTTLLKILAGLLRPGRGTVAICGHPLSERSIAAYRRSVGVVLQDDTLFNGSIADNIALFADAPDRERLIAAARLAAIDADIDRLPLGYLTRIGDMGSALSGGQRQRILLARALYKRPSILFLDEATSHLDGATEQRVSRAIADLGITRVQVAHRRSTIELCDRVIEL